jgi:hypothetical protein
MSLVLALIGTALLTLAIFAPRKPVLVVPPPLIVQEFAPLTSPAVAREAITVRELTWPRLADPRATNCDVPARLAIVAALADLRAPWADAILDRAYAEETDPEVRAALAAILDDPGNT